MQSTKSDYRGIDYFRLIAAILVVAIHTSPLSSYSVSGDFILTRAIGRVAVPFFFMASGFFMFGRAEKGKVSFTKILAFLKKVAILYLIAILLYVPLNIYTGSYQSWLDGSTLVKQLVFDGTFYHLWYLPAIMLGMMIVWLLLNYLTTRQALLLTTLLYMIGLFGDSYYGLIEQMPTINSIYGVLFNISTYTRNGVFFAPIFILLGTVIAKKGKKLALKVSLLGLIITGSLMIIEALVLNTFALQRHDSMYILLIPTMFFLFHALLHWQGKSVSGLRDLAMLVYLIHPAMIVVIRAIAQVVNLTDILVVNSFIHFVAVAVASFIASLLWLKIKKEVTSNGVR
ncbi:Surface polysaccharide O-acyltransferase, integral membrane enzyme [Amphibacillus marinus]|uniref:Surface polysaccharide O-acyltransferase, integral membrane enzyme n=1 Tax=Amphibacillus marinus TaxID=872970 RepID=A0A1H8JS82_9BACI|nr:Surface polysaccharide O-acyltransferase, integral membrane enzyme [Amphibacillus marinus]